MAMLPRSEIRARIVQAIYDRCGRLMSDEVIHECATAALDAFQAMNYVIPADRPETEEKPNHER